MPELKLSEIEPNRLNPRLEFTKAGLDELADSMKQVGLIEPIVVRPKNGRYEVVVGERRYRAAQQANLGEIPVIIRDYTDNEVIEMNFIENVHREDLTPVEKAKLCKQLLELYPDKYPSIAELSKNLGINRTNIFDWFKLLEMPEDIQKMIKPEDKKTLTRQRLDFKTASTIARKIEPEHQLEVAQKITEKNIRPDAARQFIKNVAQQPEKPINQVFREVVTEAPLYLPFSWKHAQDIMAGIKTQTARKAKDPRLQPGVKVRAQITYFADLEIESIERKRLGDFDDGDAKREGDYSLAEYRQTWKDLHGNWNPNESVYIIKFRLAGVVGESNSNR